MAPIADWLRDTRLRQRTPEGRPWSQEYLVDRVNEWARATEQGWTLYRPNYVGWEKGKEPTAPILGRLVAFWESQGEPGPDLTPKPAPLSLEERHVNALEASLAEQRATNRLLSERLDALQELLFALAGSDDARLRVAVAGAAVWGTDWRANRTSPQPEAAPARQATE